MQFSDSSTKLGMIQEVDDLCGGTNSTTYPTAAKVRRLNSATEILELLALMADGTWQFDDTNYGSQPSGVQTMVAGTIEYAFDSTLLFFERAEVKDINGNWQPLTQLDEMSIPGAIQQYQTVTGIPTQIYLRGGYMGILPGPSASYVTLTAGLKVYFKRQASLFSASDTTKTSAIASPFHPLLCQMAALPYCRTYKKDRVPGLVIDIKEGQALLKKYYASRNRGATGRMTMARINPR